MEDRYLLQTLEAEHHARQETKWPEVCEASAKPGQTSKGASRSEDVERYAWGRYACRWNPLHRQWEVLCGHTHLGFIHRLQVAQRICRLLYEEGAL